jgi:hypothetical protein
LRPDEVLAEGERGGNAPGIEESNRRSRS